MKNRFLACALLVIVLTVLANATLAYFTVEDTARNVVTSGGIDIKLVETVDEEGSLWQDVENVMPGDVIPKIVTVTNEQAEAYVRVWVDVTAVLPDGTEVKAPVEVFLENSAADIGIDFDTENWLYNETDGHFYYKTALPTGETTEALFNEVTFDLEGVGNEWQNCKLVITVAAEAVQTANNPEALGWSDCDHEMVRSDVIE